MTESDNQADLLVYRATLGKPLGEVVVTPATSSGVRAGGLLASPASSGGVHAGGEARVMTGKELDDVGAQRSSARRRDWVGDVPDRQESGGLFGIVIGFAQ